MEPHADTAVAYPPQLATGRPAGLVQDAPLSVTLADGLRGALKHTDVIIGSLSETHTRLLGPVPPFPDTAPTGPKPSDCFEADVRSLMADLHGRLRYADHIATQLAVRI